MPELVGRTLGRFVFEAHLGSGGMGEVYRARDRELRRTVAIKRVNPLFAADPQARQKLLQEARHVAGLNHPSIATLHDFFEHAGEVFLVMEYVEGLPLNRALPPLESDAFLSLAIQCVEGLEAAYEARILHGDLKPSNIMLTSAQKVKILDFGVSRRLRAVSSGATSFASSVEDEIAGTPEYLAPEIIEGRRADIRSDIFSLGIVFYETLSGVHPFRGDTITATVARIVSIEPTPLLERRPELDPLVAGIVERMLSKRPEDRYRHPESLRTALERAREGDPAGHDNRWLKAIAVVAIVLSGLLGWMLVSSEDSRASTGAPTIFVHRVANRTQDPSLDVLWVPMREALEQSRHFQLMSEGGVRTVLARMRQDSLPLAAFDIDIAREIAWRGGVPILVHPVLTEGLDGGYRLSVSIQGISESFSDEPWSESRTFQAASKETVTGMIDEASRWIREVLGENSDDIAKLSLPSRNLTTGSREALEAYTQAEESNNVGDWSGALEHYRRAVELDPEFALAYVRLADLYDWLDMGRGLPYWRRALELSAKGRLAEHERLEIEAQLAFDGGSVQQALENYKLWAESYPNDYRAHFGWAMSLHELGRDEEAAEVFRGTLETWPDNPYTLTRLAEVLMDLGRWDETERLLDRLHEVHGAEANWSAIAAAWRGRADLLRKRFDASREHYSDLLRSENTYWRSVGHSYLASVLAEEGLVAEARTTLRTGLALDRSSVGREAARADLWDVPIEHVMVLKLLALAYLDYREGRMQDCLYNAEAAIDLTDDPRRLARGGSLLAACGQPERAREVAGRLVGSTVHLAVIDFARHRILGEALLAEGRPDEALREFSRAARADRPRAEREYLARARAEAGLVDEARREYERLMSDASHAYSTRDAALLQPGMFANAVADMRRLPDGS